MWRFTPARIFTTIGLLLLVLTGPWWLALPLFLVGVWSFRQYYEALIPALGFDVLYGFSGATPLHFQFVASVFVIIVVALGDEFRGYFV